MNKRREQQSIGKAFLSSPLAVVLTVVMVVVFGLSFAGYVRRGGFWSPEVEARVFNEAGRAGNESSGANAGKRRRFAFQGEVYDQAEQVRESAALAMAATLLAAHRVLERKPFETIDALIAGVVEQGLLPPGLAEDNGSRSLISRHGTYYIRYRSDPLGLEVLSISRGIGDGVAIIVRLPDDEFSENALTYYTISKAGLQAPSGFAPVAQLISSGWRPETFKAAELSPAEKELQRQWLSARTASAK
jgi:hypothetical protein